MAGFPGESSNVNLPINQLKSLNGNFLNSEILLTGIHAVSFQIQRDKTERQLTVLLLILNQNVLDYIFMPFFFQWP